MHSIEPYYNWRHYYSAEEDEYSPFYKREYSEFYFTNTIYDYYIHPQWDDMGSSTLYLKILFVDYDKSFAIIEFIGEWNDCISNDIMYLKRDVIDQMLQYGINKFILIGENVLNYHFDSDDYYDEWFQDVEDGWIAAVNFQEHVLREFREHNIDYYLNFGGELDVLSWRALEPSEFYNRIETVMNRRLIAGS
jgi:hypothetical protein